MRLHYLLFAVLLLEGVALAQWYPRSADYNTTGDIIGDNGVFSGNVSVDGLLSSGSTSVDGKISDVLWIDDALYVSNTTTLNGTTISTGDTLAVTSADKLTVGGVIVPQEMILTIPIGTSAVDQTAFVADDAWQITKIEEVHTVAQNTAYPNTGSLSVMKCTGTQAPGSGAVLHNTTMYLNSTVETVVTPTLNATTGALNLADGNRIALNFNGTMTTFAGGAVTIHMKRI